MKLNSRPRQKMKLRVKLLIIAAAVVTATSLFFVLSSVPSSLQAVQASSYNSARCLTFNGTSSEVNFTSNDFSLGSSNKMTVTAWVKWSNKTTAGQYATIAALNKNSSSGDVGQFWLQHNSTNSNFEFAIQNASSTRNSASGTTNPSVGTWYHVAGVYDGSFVYLYVNGVLEGKTALTGNINNYQGNFRMVFGKWANSADSYRRFCGSIDEVSLWNTALTQTQIRNSMCKKLVGTEAGLVGYWRMDETSGTTVSDFTSNARNGTNTGASIDMSGAPVGDASVYTYGGTSLALANPTYGDSLTVNNFSSTPVGIQLYRIDTLPNYTTVPVAYSALSSSYYYGVFIINPNSETYKVNYYYRGNPGASIPASLGMVTRSNNTITYWSDLSATLNASSNVFSKTAQTGRNEYIPALKVSSLPIELLNFDATVSEDYVQLDWSTETETNNDFFTLERTVDGVDFELVEKQKGGGNTSSIQKYSAIDKNPLEGVSYYRLRQTDYDGKTKAFTLVQVSFSKNKIGDPFDLVKVYPNPFRDKIDIELKCKNEMKATIELIDFKGMVVYTELFDCMESYNTLAYYPKAIPDGNYILNIIAPNGYKKSMKLIRNGD
jgi:hypothetical protein